MKAWTDDTDYAPHADAHIGRLCLAVLVELGVATACCAALLALIAFAVGRFA